MADTTRRKWVILKDNYVIAAIIWDGESEYTYPEPHDKMIEDIEQNIGLGMWYEEEEDSFYMPMSKPPDLPEELNYLWETSE